MADSRSGEMAANRAYIPSLHTVIASAIIGVSFVAVLLVGVYQIQRVYSSQSQLISTQLSASAQQAAGRVNGFITRIVTSLNAAGGVSGELLVSGSSKRRRVELARIMGQQDSIREIGILDKTGIRLERLSRLSLDGGQGNKHYRDHPAWTSLIHDKVHVGKVHFLSKTNEPILTLAIPLSGKLGQFSGALIADVSVKSMWQTVKEIRIGRRGRVLVLNQEGRLLAHPQSYRVLRGEQVSPQSLIQESVENLDFLESLQSRWRPERAIFSLAQMESTGWWVAAQLPVDEAFEPLRNELVLMVGMIISTVLIAGVVGIFLSRRLSSPLQQLTRMAAYVSDGHLESDVVPRGSSEIRELALAFNRMTRHLLASVRKLKAENLRRKRAQRALFASKLQFRDFAESVADWFWEMGPDLKFNYVSEVEEGSNHISPTDFVGRTFEDIAIPLTNDRRFFEDVRNQFEQRKPISGIEFICFNDIGRTAYISISGKPLFDREGIFQGYRGAGRDITESKNAETALHDSEQRFRSAFGNAMIGMVMIESDGRFIQVNRSFCDMLGYQKSELVGRQYLTLTHPDDVDLSEDQFRQLMAGQINHYQIEKRFLHKLGKIIWTQISVTVIRTQDGDPLYTISQVQDITEKRLLHQQLSYQAAHDQLTGLVNRSEFERRLQQLLDNARVEETEHVLCFLDLDQFKVINDTCGHIAGDELLRQIPEILKAAIRNSDLLARLGGDEFGILMECCEIEDAENVIIKIHQEVENFRFIWDEYNFSIGVSSGVVPINARSVNMTDLMSMADTACYTAKEKGRNRAHIARDGVELSRRRGEMEWTSILRKALDENRFCLYAQPIVKAGSAEENPCRYELLLRMVDEAGELVLPGVFFPLAERYDMASLLDRWVVENATRWIQAHQDQLRSLNLVTINLSGRSLGDVKFLQFLEQWCEQQVTPVAPLCFEITETSAISNLANLRHLIRTLKGRGYAFALDDFGSGLSSFAYLRNLPVEYLKVDGSYIRDIGHNEIDRSLVKAINEVAHIMGIATVAECVETPEVWRQLDELGIDYVQGFAIAKPAPIEALLRQGCVPIAANTATHS